MSTQGFNFNAAHSDRWSVSFTNLPTITDPRDLAMYDRFVKSLVLPDYNMGEIISRGPFGFQVRHQAIPLPNVDLSQLQIEFKLNETMKNYLNIFGWMRNLKYAEELDPKEEFVRNNTIKGILLTVMDNQKRPVAVLTFTKCFLLSLSSLSLDTGSSEEISFTCNFSYEEIKYEERSIV